MAHKRRIRTDRGRCCVCRQLVTVVLLSNEARVAEQHPKPQVERIDMKTGEQLQPGNLLGCRGSGAIALDRFAEGPK